MCDYCGVSRGGYYAYLSRDKDKEAKREAKDHEDFKLILEAYNHRGYNKGKRSIRMYLLHKGIVMSLKKIKRLMRKYGLFCPIRKANPYRRMMKAIREDNYVANILDRGFRDHGPRAVLLTDITYFILANGLKLYLSVIKDAFTKEILAYVLSASLKVDFVLETVNDLLRDHKDELKTDVLIHSDQGVHYTSYSFSELLKDNNIRRSMSRRGNCWDNAPQESFFGHMKDEIDITKCNTLEDVKMIIDDYMDYYNNERYQEDLAYLSPSEYYRYYMTGEYPLKDIGPSNF